MAAKLSKESTDTVNRDLQLFTSPVNPTYNVGPESAYLNPAGMTGVKTTAVSAGAAVLVPVYEFDVDSAGAGGGDGYRHIPNIVASRPIGLMGPLPPPIYALGGEPRRTAIG